MSIHRKQVLPVLPTTLEQRFGLFADTVLFQTNDPRLLDAATVSFGRFELPAPSPEGPVTVRLLLENEPISDQPGVVHHADRNLYVISSPGNVAVADLPASVSTAFIDRATLADEATLRRSYIEGPALAMAAVTRGYIVVHASGIARDGIGVALHGSEGSGKTTLAVASARRGIDVFAEDGVFVRAGPEGLEFWGLPWVQRLVPDAVGHFPELAGLTPRLQPNRELKVEVDLDRVYPGRAHPSAHPAAVVVLARDGSSTVAIERLDPGSAATELEVHWTWPLEWTAAHELATAKLLELPVYRLLVNDNPEEAVDALDELLSDLQPVPLEA